MVPGQPQQGRRSRTYENPPLVEAIYEFFADVSVPTSWSDTSLENLATEFSDFGSREEKLADQDLILGVNGSNTGSLAPQVSPPRFRVRRWNHDGTRAVQYGKYMCAYNVLPPYGHFKDHVPTIERILKAYLLQACPERMAWAGQRAINIIRLPVENARADEYFEIYPRLPETLARSHAPLAVQVQTEEFSDGTAVVNLGLQAIENGHATYVLDVYARSKGAIPVDLNGLLLWQRNAHEALSNSFELSITDLSRKLFKVEP